MEEETVRPVLRIGMGPSDLISDKVEEEDNTIEIQGKKKCWET
jgi:hypothetical protein